MRIMIRALFGWNDIKKKKYILLVLAFILPAVITTIAGAYIGIEPFGDNGLLISDNSAQFAAFFTYFKHIFTSNDNFLYSFSKTLGGDMVGFSGYYFQNPLLFMLFLFPNERIAVGIFWMYVIQTGLLGVSFQVLLNSMRDDGAEYYDLIFSLGYALSGFVLSFLCLSMYFSSMIMLPIVVIGMNRFLKDNRNILLYPICLALAIFFNYYIGYMICIYCGIYFLAMLICEDGITFKASVCKFAGFVGLSAIGVSLAAFDLVPIVLSLSGQKDVPDSSIISFSINYHPIKLIRNMLPGYFHGDMSNGAAPYIYIGIIPLVGIMMFLISKHVSFKKKIAHLLIIAILVLSTLFSFTNVIWHGFNEPVGFAYRFAFLICFEMCLISAIGFRTIDGMPYAKLCLIVCLAIQIVDISYNSILTFRDFQMRNLDNQTEYESYYNRVQPVIDRIQSEDAGFYRIEKDFERNHNDAMMFGYYGLSHNSSCEKDYLKQFMGRMGNRNQGIWSFYNQGSTVFTDCLLGVKYFISRFDTTVKPYDYDFAYEDSYVFKNPYALPIGFVIERDGNVSLDNPDLFRFQNDMMTEFGAKPAYKEASYEVKTVNLSVDREYTGGANPQERTGAIEPESCNKYTRINQEEEAYIEYDITITDDGNLYFYLTAPYQQGCDVYVDGNFRQDYFTDYRWDITGIGSYKKGDTATLRLVLKDNELRLYDSYIYEENPDDIASWYAKASQSRVSLYKQSSSKLSGNVDALKDGMMVLSIPYEKGWRILIDGKDAAIKRYKDALMAVDIKKGEHTIEMEYVPDGFYLGLIVSLISLAVLVILKWHIYVLPLNSRQKLYL